MQKGMKYLLLFILAVIIVPVIAQVPQINELNQNRDAAGTVISIKGNGFSQNINDLNVAF